MPRECLTNLGEETESADLRDSDLREWSCPDFFRKQRRGVAHASNNLCLRIRKMIVAWEDKD